MVIRFALAFIPAFALALAVHGQTHRVGLRLVDVRAKGIADRLGETRLLHVSDLHVRTLGSRERRLLRLASAVKPDLLVVTGDLVEPEQRGVPPDLGAPVEVMRRLAVIAPTIAVLGNNDIPHPPRGQVVDTERLVALLERANVTVLRNEALRVRRAGGSTAVYIVGLDDNYLHRDDLDEAARGLPAGVPAILLAHSPDIVLDRDTSPFSLVLAGHTHGGQIRLPVVGSFETQTRDRSHAGGLYPLPDGRWLHVSAGVGTSAIDLRLLAPPVVTLLRIAS